MSELPSGTVTFLFTDVEGSTRMLDELGSEGYAQALAEHRHILREAFGAHGGVEVDTQGDAFFVAFRTAPSALQAAADAIEALAPGAIPVRMGIHTGTPHLAEGGYVGVDVHRAARIAACGHGGQVLISAATVALVAADRLRDLGEHRLKDLSAPERIYQLGTEDFPPLQSLYQTNLPIAPTPFLGREKELAEVLGLLSQEDVRLLTLTGPGGTGKTRLALQTAAELGERYRDGVWWIPLTPLRDPDVVLETAGRALGAKGSLAEHIVDRSMLLLFDNFERVVEAAAEVAGLLASCPKLDLLVTSREPLHIRGEQEYPVPTLVHEEGVVLFLARARAVNPDFQTDEAVSEICRRLDELPLALEMAAARVKTLSTAQIFARLEERLPLLTGGARDLPERHRTLRATIEWSYELLTPEEQCFFARLAVFRGGCTLDAAEQVTEADLDTLQSFVDKSLLRHTEVRFGMLETIREYALERLEASGELERIRRRHFDFFLASAEEAKRDLKRDQRTTMWLARLDLEHDNCRAALQWARELDEPRLELRFAVALNIFWDGRGHWDEGRSRIAGALARDPEAPAELRGHALRSVAMMAYKQGDPDAARTLAQEAAAGCRAAGDTRGLASAIFFLGIVASGERKHREARALYEESKSICEEFGDEFDSHPLLHNLGLLALDRGQHEEASRLLETALALARDNEQERDVANDLCSLGFVALGQSRHEDAQELLEESLRLCVELGWKENLHSCLLGLASVSAVAEELERAARLLGAAEALADEIHLRLEPYDESTRVGTAREVDSRLGHHRFAACLVEGRSLSFSDAVSLALADGD